MNAQQRRALDLREIDVDGALNRLYGDEAVYAACLREFLNDPTVTALTRAIRDQLWDDAFTAAHALKGGAGNMGFVPLMHAAGKLVVVLRGGRTHELPEAMEQVSSSYRDVIDAIHQYVHFSDERAKERKP